MLSKNDIQQIREVVREEIKQQLKPVNRKLDVVKKDLNYVIGSFDERIVHAHRRIDKVEEHIGMTSTQ